MVPMNESHALHESSFVLGQNHIATSCPSTSYCWGKGVGMPCFPVHTFMAPPNFLHYILFFPHKNHFTRILSWMPGSDLPLRIKWKWVSLAARLVLRQRPTGCPIPFSWLISSLLSPSTLPHNHTLLSPRLQRPVTEHLSQ